MFCSSLCFFFKVLATVKYVLSSTKICLELFFRITAAAGLKKIKYFLCKGNLSHERHGREKSYEFNKNMWEKLVDYQYLSANF
jgi:hypothetical protein